MSRSILVLVFCFAVNILDAQMPVYGADSLRKHYQKKADELIVGDSSLYRYFFIDLYGIRIINPEVEINGFPQPEYKVNWSELELYKKVMKYETREDAQQIMLDKGGRNFAPAVQKKYDRVELIQTDERIRDMALPLKGVKIAIDPGHIANDTAIGHLEQKFIYMNVPALGDTGVDETVAFAEGQLTWETAAILGYQLREAGAEVMFTRPGPGITAFGKTFEQWKQDDYPRVLDSLLKLHPEDQNLKDLKSGRVKTDRAIFRFVFKDVELRHRAEKINAFNPDLTVVIHYNVDEMNAPWKSPSDRNFTMLFVPGSFEEGELSDPEARFDFLRLLLTEDVENSIYVSEVVSKKLEQKLQVPLAKPEDAAYLAASCRVTKATGVYSRNLQMTRMVHGTIVYGETLYQDNRNESVRLNRRSVVWPQAKVTTSARVIEVAQAYYDGIVEWATGK